MISPSPRAPVYALARRSLEEAERRANAEAELKHETALSLQAHNDRLMETVTAQEGVVKEVQVDRGRHASAHGQLLRRVDKEKVRLRVEAIEHRYKVCPSLDEWMDGVGGNEMIS